MPATVLFTEDRFQEHRHMMQEILQCAVDAAKTAGTIMVHDFRTVTATEKSRNDLVTETDLKCESEIASMIRSRYPSHMILAEERHKDTDVLADGLWIVDPLDGTNNYAHGIPHFCVSIAYAERGEVIAGVVLDPMRNELFTGTRGGGAFLNGARISVSGTERVSASIITTGFYYDRGAMMEKTLDTIHSLFSADIRGIRRLGSAALDLCWVACGRFDGYFEYRLSPWDFAAGMLLVREAGGKGSDREGKELGFTSESVVVSNGRIHDEFVGIVKWKG
jgi:myo-inositol-1(or 4)-monophosphatase